MAIYRKLWLVNSLGERYDFTSKNSKSFLNEPSGFGFQRAYAVQRVGNSEKLTSEQFVLTDVVGELLFYNVTTGGIYQDYQDFIQFIKYKPLELHYQTPNVSEENAWHCDILITSIEKSEITTDNVLHCPLTMHRLSEWLTDKDFSITLNRADDTETAKHYDLVRDYHYAGASYDNAIINNVGTDEVGFLISIVCEENSNVVNPHFELKQDGKVYGICELTGTFTEVVINSVENNEYMQLKNGASILPNPESYQNFSIANGVAYITWCKIAVGETEFSFTCSNLQEGSPTFEGEINLSFKNSYVSV